MNYRLGPFGFPQGQEADNRKALNLGLKDQLAGLEWIQKNIRFFGGDKSKVSIGQNPCRQFISNFALLTPPHFEGDCFWRECWSHFYRRSVPKFELRKIGESRGMYLTFHHLFILMCCA